MHARTHTQKKGGYEGQNSKVCNSTNNPFHSKGQMTNTHTTSKDPRLAGLACCSGLFLQQTQGQLRVSREQSKQDVIVLSQGSRAAIRREPTVTSAFAHQPDNRMRLLVLAALLTGRRVPSAPPLPTLGSLSSTVGTRGHRDGQT